MPPLDPLLAGATFCQLILWSIALLLFFLQVVGNNDLEK